MKWTRILFARSAHRAMVRRRSTDKYSLRRSQIYQELVSEAG